jgi:hypothetical protein
VIVAEQNPKEHAEYLTSAKFAKASSTTSSKSTSATVIVLRVELVARTSLLHEYFTQYSSAERQKSPVAS